MVAPVVPLLALFVAFTASKESPVFLVAQNKVLPLLFILFILAFWFEKANFYKKHLMILEKFLKII